ncbi:hypothetical protein AALF15_01395 [Corynebacteriaceae bacterium 7-707]
MTDLSSSMFDLLTADETDRARELTPDPFVRFWRGGGKLELWAPCGNHMDLRHSDQDLAIGTLSVTLPGNEVWDEYFEGLPKFEARLISLDYPGGYRVAYIIRNAVKRPEGDHHVWDVAAAHVKKYLDACHLWADPLLPPEVQISGKYRAIGPAVTVLKTAWALNLARLQAEMWSIPVTNPFDPGTWNLLAKALDPIIVNPRRTGLKDTSSWVWAEWCMETAWEAGVEVCKAKDLSITVDLWLPGDAQPFPEWLTLTEPKLIVDIVPSAREVTFTGTIIDGVIRDAIKMVDDVWDWVTYPLLDPAGGIYEWIESRQGQMPIPVYRSGEWSVMESEEKTITYPSASRSTVGGKSPDWLNTLIADGVGVGISAIGTAIGLPGLRIGFIEKLAQNRLFAYHSMENRRQAAEAGRWRLRESFAGSQTTALSLQAREAALSDMWANRGRVSRRVTVANGTPYFVGRHLRPGHPVALVHEDGTVEVEVLSGVDIDASRGMGKIELTLSTPEPDEPGVFALGKVREAAGWINRLALQN